MSDLVKILHAVPVVHVPPRSRDPRTSYAPCVTEVRLPELSRREVPEGPDVPVNGELVVRTRLRDGAIWRPVGCQDAFGRKPGPDGATFKAWLEGREDTRAHDEDDVARSLEGTPVLARAPGQRTPVRPYGMWNQARVGRVLHDLREEAPDAVRDYVARRLALIDGKPFMRMPGPLAYYDEAHDRARIARYPGAWTTNAPANRGIVFRVDRIEDLARFEGKRRAEQVKPNWEPALFAGIELGGDEDTDLFLRDALRIHRVYLRDIVTGLGPFAPARVDPLLRLAARGSVGMIDPREHGAANDLVLGLSNDVIANLADRHWYHEMSKRLAAYARDHAGPRIRATAMAETADVGDDLDDLGALAR